MTTWPHALVRPQWLAQHIEEAAEPELPILDAHHHLWDRPQSKYLFDELYDDISSGHRIIGTIYVQARSMYCADASPAYQPLGEVEFANGIAARFASGLYGPARGCIGIIGCVDLLLGDAVEPVLDKMRQIAPRRLVGIRNSTAWHSDPEVRSNSVVPPSGLLTSAAFRTGVKSLSAHGLALDIWAYHTQLDDVFQLVSSLPDQRFVLDHIGGPLGVGPFSQARADVIAHWKQRMAVLAQLENVSVKIGGFGLKVMGFGFDKLDCPPSSDHLVHAWKPYIDFVIDTFGPQRCMFESNFPVDKGMFSYAVLWNAFKKVSAQYTPQERRQLFSDTALSTYRLSMP